MKWISVKERWPENKQEVLVIDKTNQIRIATFLDQWVWAELIPKERKIHPPQFLFCCDQEKTFFSNITHWMELPPEPPKD